MPGIALSREAIVACVALIAMAFAANADGPKAIATPEKADFGSYQANELKQADFKIENHGDSELKILKVNKTCGCAEVSVQNMSVAPGASTEVKVEILPESLSGSFAKNIFLETNDPSNKLLQIQVAGNAAPLYEIRPQPLQNIGRLKLGERKILAFRISPVASKFELGVPEFDSAFSATAKTQPGPGGSSDLEIAIEPPSKSGDFRLKVRIPIVQPKGWKPVEVLIAGKAGIELAAIPSRLKVAQQAGGAGTADFSLRILGEADALAENSLAFELPDGVACQALPGKPSSREMLFELKLDGRAMRKLQEAEMKVSVAHKPSGATIAIALCRSSQ